MSNSFKTYHRLFIVQPNRFKIIESFPPIQKNKNMREKCQKIRDNFTKN